MTNLARNSTKLNLHLADTGIQLLPSNFKLLNRNHFCPICPTGDNTSEEEEIALNLYLKWTPVKLIAEFYLSGLEVTEVEVKNHAVAWGWDFYRSRNTKEMYQAIIREATPYVIDDAKNLPPKELLRVAKQLDVVTGNEIAKQQQSSVFDDRAVNTAFSAIKQLLKPDNTNLDELLAIFEIEIPNITQIWKMKNGLTDPGVTITDITNHINRGNVDTYNYDDESEDDD